MYEVFDTFLSRDTRFTGDENDEMLFNEALHKIVWSDQFSPEQMAQYMRSKLNDEAKPHFEPAIARLRDNARAVKDFLKHNRTGIFRTC